MTNPSCTACNGWGFNNRPSGGTAHAGPRYDPPAMRICQEPWPNDDKTPPDLRGTPCTPRTNFHSHEPIRTRAYGLHDHRNVQLPSDKRREARDAAAAKKKGAAEK